MLTNLVKAQVESMLNRVMFPFYSKIQSDILEVKKYYLNIIKYFSLLIYPAMLILIVFGEELVFILFGERWELTIFPMKILAVAVLVDVSTSSYGLLFRSVGKPEYEMKVKLLITVLFYIPAVLVGIYLNGIIGVTFGILLTKLFSFFIAQYILSKNFGISYSDLWKSLKPAILSLLGTLILIFLITNFFPNIYFIAKILLLLSIYFLISSLFLKNEIMKLKSLKNK
ncbi:oligosaccharide flippase family protein [Tenacibaculum aquimarinum]|uniref:oligosaccharide flippase family protein n=1 Tax=Tenacibaculum aquimarinum TaxID=2910675 RepID=UPI00215DE14C|nr:oligosaccharide flippase family protein [Tenacibaculum aquimarinum]